MDQELQVGRNKAPTEIGKKGVKHFSLSGLRAYLAPLCLAGQGFSLLLYLRVDLMNAVPAFFFIFSGYLFEAIGDFSPEDVVNQPERFYFLQDHKHLSRLVVGGGVVFGLSWMLFLSNLSLRLWICLIVALSLFIIYSIGRFKEGMVLKPVLVSGAWTLVLIGFSSLNLVNQGVVFIHLFILLFLDSLWLDIRDQRGDLENRIQLFWIAKHPVSRLFCFHVLAGLLLLLFGGWWQRDLLFAHLMLFLIGAGALRAVSRFTYGLLIPLWSYFLLFLISN